MAHNCTFLSLFTLAFCDSCKTDYDIADKVEGAINSLTDVDIAKQFERMLEISDATDDANCRFLSLFTLVFCDCKEEDPKPKPPWVK
ncbi:hypothetical protein [Cytobacillus sp. IB215665]|uniref:hypothetical protein n=1 Tax=Cytobacillus sp. IB215665 TaxID=3097357 RepID=UPI002A142C30|nr:hypothetical protein [Cytobacillus sp. IB215665]MDX8368016.1 hypothetical protein [Cytobacillus sp. IB215665]